MKPIEIVQGTSLSSIIDSNTKPNETIPSNETEENLSTTSQASTSIEYRPTETISHHRSNTVPSRLRKTPSNPTSTHLSPTYKRSERTNSHNSQSLLQIPSKQRIHNIDDDDESQ